MRFVLFSGRKLASFASSPCRMGHDPRWVPPGSLVEVTNRAIHARHLLRPSRDLNDIFNGVLVRAAKRYDVGICAFQALSNHTHLLVLPGDARTLAAFMAYFAGNLAKEIGRLHDWRQHLWGRRYSHVVVSNELEAQEARLRYVLSQGCKEGLIKRPEDWPGPSSTQALLTGRTVRGVWFDRRAEYEARRCGRDFGKYEHAEVHDLELVPLPVWADLPSETRRAKVQTMVRDITAETRERIATTGRRPLGVKKILRQHPHERPARSKRSPKPIVHAASREVRTALKIQFYVFRRAYRQAAEALRAGDTDAKFPPGSHRPPLPFVSWQPPPLASSG